MDPYFSRGYYAGIRGDHLPRPTSSMLPDGISLDYAREQCRQGFNAAWAELYPTMARIHGDAEPKR